jgi:hypothetical protein
MTPLLLAVKYGRLYVVHYLISKSADPGPEPGSFDDHKEQFEYEQRARSEASLNGTSTSELPPYTPINAWTVALDESVSLRKPPVDRKMLNEAIKLGIQEFEGDQERLRKHVKRPPKFRAFQDAVIRLAKAQRYLADAYIASRQGQHESSWILTEHAERVTTDSLLLSQEIEIRAEAKSQNMDRKTRYVCMGTQCNNITYTITTNTP